MLVNENNDDSASIDIRGGNDNYIGETKMVGFKKTVMLKDTENNTVVNNEVLTEAVANIFSDLEFKIQNLQIDSEQKKELSQIVTNMKIGFGSGDFEDAYKEFASFSSNHVATMNPMLPFIIQLAAYLPLTH